MTAEIESKPQGKRKCAFVCVVQIVFGLIGAALTVVCFARFQWLENWLSGDKAAASFMFNLAMYVSSPTALICKVVGVPQGPAWLVIGIVVNTALFVLIGTVIGISVRKLATRR